MTGYAECPSCPECGELQGDLANYDGAYHGLKIRTKCVCGHATTWEGVMMFKPSEDQRDTELSELL